MQQIPTLETERLVLRPLAPEDAAAVRALGGNRRAFEIDPRRRSVLEAVTNSNRNGLDSRKTEGCKTESTGDSALQCGFHSSS